MASSADLFEEATAMTNIVFKKTSFKSPFLIMIAPNSLVRQKEGAQERKKGEVKGEILRFRN